MNVSRKNVWWSAGIVLMVYLVLTFSLNSAIPKENSSSYGTLRQKTLYYLENAAQYDLLFLGDSRTFCGIDPDYLDEIVGTRSYNLAHWANWFPTQYAQFSEVIPLIPEGTTVVWTLGHQNFGKAADSEEIKTNYPIRRGQIKDYLSWGYSLGLLSDNLAHYAHENFTFLYPSSRYNIVLNNYLRKEVSDDGAMDNANPDISDKVVVTSEELAGMIAHQSSVGESSYVFEADGHITSVLAHKTNGNYTRIELDSAFFRLKQGENAEKVAASWDRALEGQTFQADPKYWNNFVAILQLFHDYKIKLIVNDIEEAPNNYGNQSAIREYFTSFTLKKVKPYVESMGFTYVKANFDQITNEYYFDYNHLNSKGVKKYSTQLAELIHNNL